MNLNILKKGIFWIVLLSAAIRLYKIDGYAEFLGDQGRDVVIVSNFIKNGDLMFIGPQTSIGNMYLGPWYYYFIAPSLLIANFNPIGPAIFVSLLAVFTTYLIYKFVSGWLSPGAGIVSALIFSISPVIVKYTSFSWNPNVMPLFSLLFIWFLMKKRYILASLCFIMVLNIHYLGLLLLFPAAAILVFSRPSKKTLFLSLVIILLGFLPLMVFDIKHKGQNINSITKFFTVRQETVNLKPYKAIPLIFPLSSQIVERTLAGKEKSTAIIYTVIIMFFLIFSVKFFKKDKTLLYLELWISSGVVGLALYKQHIYDHYFGFLYVPLTIFVGYIYSKSKPIGVLLLVLSLYGSLKNTHLKSDPNYQIKSVDDITQSIVQDSQGKPFNFTLLAKQNYDPPYRYFLDLKKSNLKEINQEKTKQLYVVCEPTGQDCSISPQGNPEYGIAAFGPSSLEKTWKYKDITIYKLVPAKL